MTLTNTGKGPDAWRNHGIKSPLPACNFQVGDLKKLYHFLEKRQIEYRDFFLKNILAQQPNETEEQFSARYNRVFAAFVTSVTISTLSGVMLTGNNEDVLAEKTLPDDIKFILFSTKSVPGTVMSIVPCFINVFLDFTQPPLFDFSRLPTLATPNETNFEVHADNEAWFWAAKAELDNFFAARKSGNDWMHRAGIYDLLLSFCGLPFGLWASYRIGMVIAKEDIPIYISVGIYVYIFFFALSAFRLI